MKNNISENDLLLPIVEEFYTIQGEGFHTGKAAYFIRIGGCDIGCRWCDTKISWDSNLNMLVDINEIATNATKYPAKAIVVTGGEPLIYNLNPLCAKLKENNIETYLETCGAYKLTGEWDWICLSPKKHKHPHKDLYIKANELKVIVYDDSDLIWAEECSQKVSANCKLFLQPEWSRYETTILSVVEYVKANPKWNISIQSHKFMHIP